MKLSKFFLPYSSPSQVNPTVRFRELIYYSDNAGPRRVSSLIFLENPIHWTNWKANTEAKVVVPIARVVVVAFRRTQVRACIVPRTSPFVTVRARCPRLAPKIIGCTISKLPPVVQTDWTDYQSPIGTDVFAVVLIHGSNPHPPAIPKIEFS
jgi:hypothetical protein